MTPSAVSGAGEGRAVVLIPIGTVDAQGPHPPFMTTADVVDALQRNAVVLPRIGTSEANGQHSPVGVDLPISAALAEAVAKETDGVWLPLIPYGVSEALRSFPGSTLCADSDKSPRTAPRIPKRPMEGSHDPH